MAGKGSSLAARNTGGATVGKGNTRRHGEQMSFGWGGMGGGHHGSGGRTSTMHRGRGMKLAVLRGLYPYLWPYRLQVVGFLVALGLGAAAVLALGLGLKYLVDGGFAQASPVLLDRGLMILGVIIGVMAVATYARFFLISWIGERVAMDLRRKVFDHVVGLSVAFFETTKIGEVLSRLTTDTTILQSMVGSAVSLAIRHAVMLVGGLAMLMYTSWELTGPIFLIVPVVVVPVVIYGRLSLIHI